MARVLHDWLASFQELPIQGVGVLSWRRRPALLLPDRKTVQAPQWTLVFESDHTVVPVSDFFDRLATIDKSGVKEVEQQYRSWLKQFNGNETKVELWGLGNMQRAANGTWSAQFEAAPSHLATTLDRLPVASTHSSTRWQVADRFVIALMILAMGWVIWLGIQANFRWGVGSFKPNYKEQPISKPEPSYREIR